MEIIGIYQNRHTRLCVYDDRILVNRLGVEYSEMLDGRGVVDTVASLLNKHNADYCLYSDISDMLGEFVTAEHKRLKYTTFIEVVSEYGSEDGT